MSKHEDDILQIKKYLTGKLDARAMYELERRAQDDPFLQDALDGYENVAKPQDENLKELSQRLKARTAEKHSRVIPMRFIAIAASVLLFLFAGLFWLIDQHKSHPQNKVSKIVILQEKKIIDTLPTVTTKKPELVTLNKLAPSIQRQYKSARKPEADELPEVGVDSNSPPAVANAESKVAYNAPLYKSATSNNKDSTPLNEVAVMGYAEKKKTDVAASVAEVSMDTLKSKIIKGLVRDENGPLAGAVVSIKGTTINTTTDKNGYFKIPAVPNNSVLAIASEGYTNKQVRIKKQDSLIVSMQPFNNVLSGKVAGLSVGTTDKPLTGLVTDGNAPIPGATIKIKGTNTVVQTDANGKFTLPGAYKGITITVAMIGYETQAISTTDKKKSLIVTLQPNNASLAEVMVTGYGTTKKDEEYQSARPANGWSEFRKYIKENAQSPDGKTGVVKVSFVVNSDNSLSNFRVLKGISAQTDTAAIDLISNGPYWLKNTNNKPETIKVRVKFAAKKQ